MNAHQARIGPEALEVPVSAEAHGLEIQDACAWILRVGVVASVVVMLAGLALSFGRHPVSVDQMQHATFDGSGRHLWQGLRELRGQAVIELGIYLLVLTPIVRVFMSVVLFAIEHDRLYAIVTFVVLVMTLAGLLLMK
jgi:uncharacterized membrane protein